MLCKIKKILLLITCFSFYVLYPAVEYPMSHYAAGVDHRQVLVPHEHTVDHTSAPHVLQKPLLDSNTSVHTNHILSTSSIEPLKNFEKENLIQTSAYQALEQHVEAGVPVDSTIAHDVILNVDVPFGVSDTEEHQTGENSFEKELSEIEENKDKTMSMILGENLLSSITYLIEKFIKDTKIKTARGVRVTKEALRSYQKQSEKYDQKLFDLGMFFKLSDFEEEDKEEAEKSIKQEEMNLNALNNYLDDLVKKIKTQLSDTLDLSSV